MAICPHCHQVVDDSESVFGSDSSMTMTAVRVAVASGTESTTRGVRTNPEIAPSAWADSGKANSGKLAAESREAESVAGRPSKSDPPAVSHSPTTHPTPEGGPSRLAWQLLLTYASLMTLAALFLGWQLWRRPSRDLLDLPDLAPPAKKDGRVTTLIYVPAGKPLLSGHQLDVGESRRFGSLEITPLGVSRGPLRFEYFDPLVDRNEVRREPSGEVLQLHLRVKNVSADQTFIPFDRHLVYARETNRREEGQFKANNLVWNRADPEETVLYLYDLSPDSDWIVAGQNLDRELAPGESIDVFLPSTEPVPDELPEELVWRFHFRKGYNRRSLRGVTTVAEVCFRRQQISEETPATSWRVPAAGLDRQSALYSVRGVGRTSSLPPSP
jgi:hypothetical protein